MSNKRRIVRAREYGRVKGALYPLLVSLVGWISTTYHSAVGQIMRCGVLRPVSTMAMSGMEESRTEKEEGRQSRGGGTNHQDRKEWAGSGGRYPQYLS